MFRWLIRTAVMLSLAAFATIVPSSYAQEAVRFLVEPALPDESGLVQFTVYLDTGVQEIDAAQFSLRFDPARVQIVDAEGRPAEAIVAGPHLDIALMNQVDAGGGWIEYSAGRLFPPFPRGRVLLASFVARIVDATDSVAPFEFQNAAGRETMAVFEGRVLPHAFGGAPRGSAAEADSEEPDVRVVEETPSEQPPADEVSARSEVAETAAPTLAVAALPVLPGQVAVGEDSIAICHATGGPENPHPYQLMAVPTSTVPIHLLEHGDVFPVGDSCPELASARSAGIASEAGAIPWLVLLGLVVVGVLVARRAMVRG